MPLFLDRHYVEAADDFRDNREPPEIPFGGTVVLGPGRMECAESADVPGPDHDVVISPARRYLCCVKSATEPDDIRCRFGRVICVSHRYLQEQTRRYVHWRT